MFNINVAIIFSLLLSGNSCKQSSPANDPPLGDAVLQTTVITSALNQPWDLVWGPDGKLWMTERGGKVSRVDTGTGSVTLVSAISDVQSMGEGGLLGMVLHPNFSATPHVFVAYNYDNAGTYREKIVRFTYNGSALVSPVILLDNINASGIHNGCRLLISADLKLFITTGDAANQPSAQNLSSLNGKVLRINLDGTIPADNPNPASPVWSSGHRNAQGLVFANGKLYASEHGPNTDDEVNIIQKGRNYGWPNVNGFCNEPAEQTFCTANNIVQPIYAWTPTLAVCGMDYYSNDLIPQWKNSLLMTTLKDNTLYQLKLNAAGDAVEKVNEFYRSEYGRLRDVCVTPDGKVFMCTGNGGNDKIIRINKKS
ncbi:MAG: PQQ-dependent sugar dehydrogenase [Chitinophagaceae bacterium]|nr:PQQ-dependent sugar dehydrogenase [Chitinophagaceae bacterium]